LRIRREEKVLPADCRARFFAQQQLAVFFEMSLNTRRVAAVVIKGVELKAGDRVRIRPKHDEVFSDVTLMGKIGLIEAFEQDADHRVHVALVLDGEPAQSGAGVFQSRERFLFTLDEIEPV
jgi:hypothetical protein